LASGSGENDLGTILVYANFAVGGLAAVRGVAAINGLGSTLARSVLEYDIGVALDFSFYLTISGRAAGIANSIGLTNWIKLAVGYGGGALERWRCAR